MLRVETRRHIFYPSLKKPSPVSVQQGGARTGYHPTLPASIIQMSNDSNAPESSTGFRELIGRGVRERPENDATPAGRWSSIAKQLSDEVPPGAYAGRTVEIRSGDSIRIALTRLNHILKKENNITKELNLAKRHEQKGEKRRRLRSERWRRKFNDEVRQRVQLVLRINARDRMWGLGH